jgi:hypothetical protein
MGEKEEQAKDKKGQAEITGRVTKLGASGRKKLTRRLLATMSGRLVTKLWASGRETKGAKEKPKKKRKSKRKRKQRWTRNER